MTAAVVFMSLQSSGPVGGTRSRAGHPGGSCHGRFVAADAPPATGRTPSAGSFRVRYEGGPITVTGVPMGVSGQTWAAVAMGISTHPLLCGVP